MCGFFEYSHMESSEKVKELRQKLAKVRSEIQDMVASSYSQSNPAYVLGLRSLRRMEERLVSELDRVGVGS